MAILILNLYASSFAIPLMIAVASVSLMVAGRISYRRQLLMIAFPMMFATFVIVSQILFEGSEVFYRVGPLNLHMDGLLHGLFLSLRIVAGGLTVVLLGVSTPLNRLCLGLRWFRIPLTFLEILQLTYRYLFDIRTEFYRMRDAQRARLGWSSAKAGLSSSKMLGGSLFLRVFERGLRSSEAMRCRGSGPVVSGPLEAPARLDLAAGLIAGIFVICLLTLSVAGWL